jgi:hypothetical protein
MPADGHIQYTPEPSGVATGIVVWCGIGALALLAAAIGGFTTVYNNAVPIKTVPRPEEFPQPRVVTSAVDAEELRRLRTEQTERLETWGWANDQHTLVRIPIGRAMMLLAQKGGDGYVPRLPPQPALNAPTAAAQNAITPFAPASSHNPPTEEKR